MIGAFSKSVLIGNTLVVSVLGRQKHNALHITRYLEVMQHFTKLLAGECVLQATTPLLVLC